MVGIEDTTGQARLAAEIVAHFGSGARVCALSGPPGAGKSRTAALVSKLIDDQYWTSLRRGEELHAATPEMMLIASKTRLDSREIGQWSLDVAKDVSEVIESGSVPFSRTLSRLLGLRRKGEKEKVLSDREQEFLYELSFKRQRKRCLLVADNLHYWDAQSLTFLAKVTRGLWDQEYPDLPSTRTLLIWTDDAGQPDFEDRARALFGADLRQLRIGYLPQQDFRTVFRAMGAPQSVPDAMIDRIYAVCQGDLLFGHQLAELLAETPNTSLSTDDLTGLSQALAKIVMARLDRLGTSAPSLRDFMTCLCTIAQALPSRELTCLFSDKRDQLQWCLDQAKRLGLVEKLDDNIRVTHEDILRAFQIAVPENRAKWHAKFSSCLAQLRPADYSLRALHLEKAGETRAAMTCRIHGVLQSERQMQISPGDGWSTSAAPLDAPMTGFLNAVESALSEEREQRYGDAVHILENCPLGVPDTLVAERDLLLAKMLARIRTASANDRALHLLEDWDSLKEREPDIWLRLMECRLVMLSHLNRRSEAREVERRTRQVCDERGSYDHAAVQVDMRLRRRAEAIHAPRIANDRLKRALAFLDPTGEGKNPKDLVEYVITLNNLAANEMVLGEFDAAFSRIAQAFQVMERSRRLIVKRPEIVLSNLVLAHFLKTSRVPSQIDVLQQAIENLAPGESDVSLVKSNLAALQIYSGDLRRGYQVLYETGAALAAVPDFSPYYVYFVHSNLAVAAFLMLQQDESDAAYRRAQAAMEKLEPDLLPYARERMRLLQDAMGPGADRSLQHLSAQLDPEAKRIGETWRLHGRPLTLSDLQFWTEG